MVQFDCDPLLVEDGVMFGRVTIDGAQVRAGITLPAFEQLIRRAGFDPDGHFGAMIVGDLLGMLKPTIEAYLQVKHFHDGMHEPLVIDTPDLVTH